MAMRDDFETLWRDLARFVPTDMRDAGDEFRKNFQDFVAASLRQMNLVTREEYDIQVNLLRRLEQQVAELERKADGSPSSPADAGGDESQSD